MPEIYNKLFVNWELDTWANVLELVGFTLAVLSFIIGLIIKSEINKLKTQYIFDKRIKDHLVNLENIKSNINQYLNDYDNSKELIRTELTICQTELKDLYSKLNFRQSLKSRRLVFFIIFRKDKPFSNKASNNNLFLAYLMKLPKRLYTTTYDDIWIIYNKLIGTIRQVENIHKNNKKSLR